MKKNLFLIICCVVVFSLMKLSAQPTLYGTTQTGYQSSGGTLFSFNVADSVLEVKNRFDAPEGGLSPHGLIVGSNGLMYGTTSWENGTVFEYNPIKNIFTKKVDFTNSIGTEPFGNVAEIPGNKIIGTCMYGGAFGYGTIYEYDITNNSIIKLYDFKDSVGGILWSGIFLASNGKLYGAAYMYGLYGYGSLYEFDINTNTVSVIHSFDGSDGAYPLGNLCEVNNKLYGTTVMGGTNQSGAIYEYDLTSNSFATVGSFDASSNGLYPVNINPATNGLLYGTTYGAGLHGLGVLYSFDPSSGNINNLRDFSGYGDGLSSSQLMQASDGNLYGTINTGYDNNGSIFQYNITTSTYSNIKNLDSATGVHPDFNQLIEYTPIPPCLTSNLVVSAATICNGDSAVLTATGADFYFWNTGDNTSTITVRPTTTSTYTVTGTSITNGCFQSVTTEVTIALSLMSAPSVAITSGATATVTASGADSYLWSTGDTTSSIIVNPASTITYTVTGTSTAGCSKSLIALVIVNVPPTNPVSTPILMGTPQYGGQYGYGTLFSFNTANNILEVKHNFDYANGAAPSFGKPLLASNGLIYGTTIVGGNSGYGVLYEYNPLTNVFTKKADLNGTTGYISFGALIERPGGRLVGGCYLGGANGSGTIFEYDIANDTIIKLHDFYGNSGGPYLGITLASNGKLYGTSLGGNGGVLYEFDLNSNTLSVIQTFNGENGATPVAKVHEANNKLYGTTVEGGTYNGGTIYEYDLSSGVFTTKANLNPSVDGSYPASGINLATNGLFYGVTMLGGNYGKGTLYSFEPNSGSINTLYDFNYVDGPYSLSSNSVMQASDGNLYGMTTYGNNGLGSIFQYNPVTSVFTEIKNLDSITGFSPTLTELTEYYPCSTNNMTVNSATICNGDSAILTASGADAFLWSTGDTTATIIVTPTTSSNYTVTGTSANGCTQSVMAQVTLNALPTVTSSVSPSATVCEGSTVILSGSGASSYSWSGGITDGEAFIATSTTTYTVTGTDVNGCINTDTTKIKVNALPNVTATSDTICLGATAKIKAKGAATYIWSTGATTASLSISSGSTTTYTVTGTNNKGCTKDAYSTVTVNVVNLTVDSATICKGETAVLNATGANSYKWSNGDTTAAISVSPAMTKIYTVTGTASNGCTKKLTAKVLVNALPIVTSSVSPSATVCEGNTVILSGFGAASYSWSGGVTDGITFIATSTTTYTVTGIGINGCTNTDTRKIKVNALPNVTATSDTICVGAIAKIKAKGAATYVWSTGATTASLSVSPDSTTTYTVTGTSNKGCTKDAYSTIIVDSCAANRSNNDVSFGQLSIVDTLQVHKFYLYPNPSSGNIILDYTLNLTEHGAVVIYDILGKFISAYELDNSSNQLLMRNENLETGTYFYKVLVNGLEVKREKIILMR
jgi:uncharacterized repeat protein (TIGR03803 family)